jgi:regulatory protein
MKITEIKQQEKLKSRYSVYVEGEYAFSLSDTVLLERKLAPGDELTKEQVDDYKKLSAEDRIYNQVLRYIAIRPRSSWEIKTYLTRKNASPPLQEKILNMLSKHGYVNDVDFARSWVQNRRLLKPTSRRRLTLELRQKHVSDEVVREVLEEDETDERQTLKELIERKRKQSRYQDETKLMQYLARQGFSYNDIKDVLADDET